MLARNRLIARIALSAAVLVVALGVAEVAYRLWFYGPPGLSPTRLASVRPLGETGFTTDSPVPAIGYRLRPDLRDWYLLHPFETNSKGLRDREYELEKPPSTVRVAVVGDSYTMGSGVPIEGVFHSVLEERLNARSGERRYEFVNFGVGGYSLLHELAVIEHEALRWDPDLILLAVISNDAPPPSMAYFRNLFPDHPGIPPRSERPRPPPAPTAYARLTLLDDLLAPAPPPPDPDRAGAPYQGPTREELGVRAVLGQGAELTGDERYLDVVFARLRELSDQTGVPVFCVYLSTSDSDYLRSFAEQFELAARGAGLPFLDTCPLLRGLARREVVILPDDGHPNARVHRLYADGLEPVLRAGGYLEPRGAAPGD